MKFYFKKNLKKYGSILLFIFLFPYICGVFWHNIKPIEIKEERVGEYKVQVETEVGIETMPLDKYLIGILPTVIPITYEEETLKAQMVILRTDILKKYLEQGNGNRIIDATKLPYEYQDQTIFQRMWKEEFEKNTSKVQKVILETQDMVMTYQGIPMEVPFFAISAGKTRNGKEVFGNENYPYLIPVECQKDILAQNYKERTFLTPEQLKEKLEMPALRIEEIKISKSDEQGYVLEVELAKEKISGEDFRKKLNLPSSHFVFEKIEENLCITTNGVGHGLGMSQYAANQMALEGSTFLEILPYFYTGTQIQKQ